MFEETLTGDILLNDPHVLSKYLDDLSNETANPFINRKAHLLVEMNTEIEEAVHEITRKEGQVKLLVEFIHILMDVSQDKMLQQNETIEKQEQELKDLTEERSHLSDELSMLKHNFEIAQEKCMEFEKNMVELEERYEKELYAAKENKMEVQALLDVKSKYKEVKKEARRNTMMNQELIQEKDLIQYRLEDLKMENSKQKEELQMKIEETAKLAQELEEVSRAKATLEKLVKDFENERETLTSENVSLREAMEILDERCRELESELDAAKRRGFKDEETVEEEHPEDQDDNINAKVRSMTVSQQPTPKQGSQDFARPSYAQSPAFGMNNYFNQEDNDMASFANLRTTLTSHLETPLDLKEYLSPSFPETMAPQKQESEEVSIEARNSKVPVKVQTNASEASNKSTDCSTAATPAPGGMFAFSQVSNKRKDILEEFYLLTWQTVLLNSPNFNEMAGKINPHDIYTTLVTQGIPFFKWHSWIVRKMDELYQAKITPAQTDKKKGGFLSAFGW